MIRSWSYIFPAKVAFVKLKFGTPEEIFDRNYLTKTPVVSDDFMDWIHSAFRLIPQEYKINLDILFDDLQGYSEENLEEIFRQNILLEYRAVFSEHRRQNRTALKLILTGIGLFIAMMTATSLWKGDGIFRQICLYALDIGTTVTIWEALYILVVQRIESLSKQKNLTDRFAEIKFRQASSDAKIPENEKLFSKMS